MMIFNALFGVLFAVAAPEQPAVDVEADVAVDEGDVSSEALDFTDEVDPSEVSRWECWDDDDRKKRGYCLARCEGEHRYRAVTEKIRVRGNRDLCKSRARKHCNRRGDHVRNWCFGERDRDDDNHDNHHD